MSKQNKRQRALLAALEDIHSRVPPVNCEGKCGDSCRPLGDAVAPIELARIRKYLGEPDFVFPGEAECSSCPLLSDQGSFCIAHQVRPLICRLYGVARDRLMACPHGCRGGSLSNSQARELWNRILELSSAYESELRLGESHAEALGNQSERTA
jgi:Fe-S-cluster containining protein